MNILLVLFLKLCGSSPLAFNIAVIKVNHPRKCFVGYVLLRDKATNFINLVVAALVEVRVILILPLRLHHPLLQKIRHSWVVRTISVSRSSNYFLLIKLVRWLIFNFIFVKHFNLDFLLIYDMILAHKHHFIRINCHLTRISELLIIFGSMRLRRIINLNRLLYFVDPREFLFSFLLGCPELIQSLYIAS